LKDIKFEDVASFEALMRSADECCKGIMWKSSTQMFKANQIRWCSTLSKQLINGEYKPRGFNEFDICERGKQRHIMAVHITERCVQKSLVQNALRPIIEPRLIYDNSASQKYKGTDFALMRLKKHLVKHYKKYGRKGGILTMDYASYFDSIDHNILLTQLKDVIKDERVFNLTKLFIDAFPGDTGLGLGSEVSQICAIYYPNEIDHYIKEQLHIKGYGRYMDDSYFISDDIDYLKYCKNEIENKLSELKISVNNNITNITRFTCGNFSFLKKRICITNTGKILMKLDRKNVTRIRRKLKSMKNKGVGFDSAHQTYQSWRGYALHYNSYNTVKNIDKLFYKLWGDN
jgi:retron-type reverse transcriptase